MVNNHYNSNNNNNNNNNDDDNSNNYNNNLKWGRRNGGEWTSRCQNQSAITQVRLFL